MKVFSDAILAQHTAILGKTGSGKTSTAKLLIEQVVPEGARVCILDPIKSDWWGLTSSADGQSPGLPFHILGGPHGHVPINEDAGSIVAEVVANGSLPLSIIDMRHFKPGGTSGFFAEFAKTLLEKNEGVVYLVIEEAHLFAPKERAGFANENMAVHWAKTLATAGRSAGIRLILCTQRVQALHNALLGSCDTLIAQRLTAPADQKPIVDWLKSNVSDAMAKEVAASISSLKTGEGWICSGEAKLFERVQFPPIKTFDNSATPTANSKRRTVQTAPVDLGKLAKLIGIAGKKEAPAQSGRSTKDEDLIKALNNRLVSAEQEAERWKSLYRTESLAREELAECMRNIRARADGAIIASDKVTDTVVDEASNKVKVPEPEPASRTKDRSHVPAVNMAHPITEIPKPHRKILSSLAWWRATGNDVPDRAAVAAFSGFSVGGGTFTRYLSALSSGGWIEYAAEGRLKLTAKGLTAVEVPKKPSIREAQQRALEILDAPVAKILRVVIDGGGKELARSKVAELAGFTATGGTFIRYCSTLSSLRMIVYPNRNTMAPAKWLIGGGE